VVVKADYSDRNRSFCFADLRTLPGSRRSDKHGDGNDRVGNDSWKIESWRGYFRSINPELVGETVCADERIKEAITALGKITSEDDIIVADGPGITRAAAYLLSNAEYRDLFCMDEHEMPGVGLPFAIGAAIGNPRARVTLICDKESLFAHVRELSPATMAGVSIRIIVADEQNATINGADTASVLEGLMCSVQKFLLNPS